jgi:hypothetical protein
MCAVGDRRSFRCYCQCRWYTRTSTRRLWTRPSPVVVSATGTASPSERTRSLSRSTVGCCARYAATVSARRRAGHPPRAHADREHGREPDIYQCALSGLPLHVSRSFAWRRQPGGARLPPMCAVRAWSTASPQDQEWSRAQERPYPPATRHLRRPSRWGGPWGRSVHGGAHLT